MALSKAIKWPKIFLYGDSITQRSFSADGCWGSLVADHFQRRAEVVVRGFSGYNTRHCKALLPYVASDLDGVVGATVFLGANDASCAGSPQAVPLPEYVLNLKAIVTHFQGSGVLPVVITPPAFDEVAWKQYCVENKKPFTKEADMTTKYVQACVGVAAELGVLCVDLHTAMINQTEWKTLLCDGLHLSRRGSELLASMVIPTLEKQLSDHLPSDLLLPLWDEIDSENPGSSFANWCQKSSKK